MMLTNRLFAFCLLLQTADVVGSVSRRAHGVKIHRAAREEYTEPNSTEAMYYDSTVTTEMGGDSSSEDYDATVSTEMGYYESEDDNKSVKKGHHDRDYEYVSADGKMGKKGDRHTLSPTYDGKGGKKGGNHTKAPKKGIKSKSSKAVEKSSKAGKSGKKGGHHPTTAPSGGTSEPTPGVKPTEAPAQSPSATASPTDEGSVAFDLDPFSLLYDTETKRQASRAELAELTDVTRLYLEDFMFDEFSGSSFTFLDDFVTKLITSTFLKGDEPYIVDYSATARFNPFSTVFPSTDQLNEALVIAFSGSNMAEYERRLTGLSENNVFYGASSSFGEPVDQVTRAPSSNATAIAAAAVAATLLAAGAVLYKRRVQAEIDEKGLIKNKGDSTVAGDTFAGETSDGSASASVASHEYHRKFRDYDNIEEEAKGPDLLGTIEEEHEAVGSVRASWGAKPWRANESYDDEEADLHALQKNLSMDNISLGSEGTEDDEIRRAATDTSDMTTSATDMGATLQSFDNEESQGLAQRLTRNETNDDDTDDHDDDHDDDDTSHACEADHNGRFDCQEELARDSKPEVASLLSPAPAVGVLSIARTVSSSSSTKRTRRPKTVEEIEAMLTADADDYDEESHGFSSRSQSFGNDNSSSVTSLRPRTVEEIESLLSTGIDDDCSQDDNEFD